MFLLLFFLFFPIQLKLMGFIDIVVPVTLSELTKRVLLSNEERK